MTAKHEVQYQESFADVRASLMRLSAKLQELLPDPSIGPEERIERLGRVAPGSILRTAGHLTARTKLGNMRARLRELVPDPALTDDERIDRLVARAHELAPGAGEPLIEKLERLGDGRFTDSGHMGIDEELAERLRRVVYRRPATTLKHVIEWVAEVLDRNPDLVESLHARDDRMRRKPAP